MARRTKACAICRQKRIKCDATMPHCQMCLKFNRQCPGPTDAPLMFVDTSSYPSGKKPRKRPSLPSSKKPLVKPEPKSSTDAEYERARGNMQLASTARGDVVGRRGDLPSELVYVTLVQISGRYVTNEALFSSLARFFCAEGRYMPGAPQRPPSWLHALPRLATQPPSTSVPSKNASQAGPSGKEALSLAIRATTAAFGGIEARNTGLLEYAAGLYGEALRAQGRVVARNASGSGGKKEVGMDMVAASVMLGMFEAIVATTGRAYAEHIIGAAKMLDVAMTQSLKTGGPPSNAKGGGVGCGDGSSPAKGPGPLLTHIFFHIRVQLAFVLLTSVEERVRCNETIERVLINACAWPFARMPLNQQIVRPLARLINLTFPSSHPSRSPSAISRLATYTAAREEVHTLWTHYENENQSQNLVWYNSKAGQTDFRDPFTAIQYAYFAACWLLLARLAPSTDTHQTHTRASPPASPTSSCSLTSFLDAMTPTNPHSRSLPLRPSASPPPPPLRDSSTPSSTQNSVTPSPPSDPHLPTSTDPHRPTEPDHFALILSVSSFLKIRDVGFSYLRLHLPLFLVALYAPSGEQRRAARRVFEEWEGGALRGIGVLALERLGVERV